MLRQNTRVVSQALLLVGLLAGGRYGAAQTNRSLLEGDPLEPAARITLRLHAGSYHLRTSSDDRLHVSETRETADASSRRTDVQIRVRGARARLEIDPPTGKHGPQITIAVPRCAELDLTLTAGELILDGISCEATRVSLHAGEVQANLGDAHRYRTVKASVSIGEVDTPGLGPAGENVQRGGFFRSFERDGPGTQTFEAHVGSGQITLEGARQ